MNTVDGKPGAAVVTIAYVRRAVPAGPPPLTRGELLCQAFEAYRLYLPAAQISFEHAVFLTTALSRGDQLRLGGLLVTERFPLRARRCHHCSGPPHARC